MQIRGLRGTEFRAVFEYVNHKFEVKEFTNLKGVIYVDDGFYNLDVPSLGYKTGIKTRRYYSGGSLTVDEENP